LRQICLTSYSKIKGHIKWGEFYYKGVQDRAAQVESDGKYPENIAEEVNDVTGFGE
jgi:hypothetical protein